MEAKQALWNVAKGKALLLISLGIVASSAAATYYKRVR
jgi:hypothetical protein